MFTVLQKGIAALSNRVALMGNTSASYNTMSFLHIVDVPTKKATFAMGCFWAPDSLYGAKKGVIRTRVGYTGGTKVGPSYKSLGDHTEAIDIDFDPKEVTYEELLDIFWKHHDPSSPSSRQYSSFIYYHDDEQKEKAAASLKAAEAGKRKTFLTQIIPATEFYEAEDYHQKYRLQQLRDMCSSMGLTSREALVNSHVAARLNGYIVGQGGVKQFDEEASKLGLSGDILKEIRKYVVRNEGQGLHC